MIKTGCSMNLVGQHQHLPKHLSMKSKVPFPQKMRLASIAHHIATGEAQHDYRWVLRSPDGQLLKEKFMTHYEAFMRNKALKGSLFGWCKQNGPSCAS